MTRGTDCQMCLKTHLNEERLRNKQKKEGENGYFTFPFFLALFLRREIKLFFYLKIAKVALR